MPAGRDAERELTVEESDEACIRLDKLGKKIRELGYCWNNGEQEWWPCASSQRIPWSGSKLTLICDCEKWSDNSSCWMHHLFRGRV